MTRKRLKKLLMGMGYSRNYADEICRLHWEPGFGPVSNAQVYVWSIPADVDCIYKIFEF